MPVFEATDSDNPPVRMDSFDEDEVIYLRPHVTYLLEQRAKGKGTVWPEGLTREQLRTMPQDDLERLAAESTDQSRIDEEIILSMVERWTLRRAPSKAQREQGERGDLVPLSREAIRDLPPAVGTWLRAEIEKRRDIVPATAEVGPAGDDFRHTNDLSDHGRLPGPSGDAGHADTQRSGSDRANGLGARGAGPRAARTA